MVFSWYIHVPEYTFKTHSLLYSTESSIEWSRIPISEKRWRTSDNPLASNCPTKRQTSSEGIVNDCFPGRKPRSIAPNTNTPKMLYKKRKAHPTCLLSLGYHHTISTHSRYLVGVYHIVARAATVTINMPAALGGSIKLPALGLAYTRSNCGVKDSFVTGSVVVFWQLLSSIVTRSGSFGSASVTSTHCLSSQH